MNFLNSSLFFQAQVFEDVSDEGFFLWPMLAFVCLILTLVFIFLGVVNMQTAKKEWSLYFNAYGSTTSESDSEYQKRKKALDTTKKKGIIFIVLGVLMIILGILFIYLDKSQLAQLNAYAGNTMYM